MTNTATQTIEATTKRIVENEVMANISTMIHELYCTGNFDDEIMPVMQDESWESAFTDSADVPANAVSTDSNGTDYYLPEDERQVYVARFNLPGCMPDTIYAFGSISDCWQSLAESFMTGCEGIDDLSEEAVDAFYNELLDNETCNALHGPDGCVYVVDEGNIDDLDGDEFQDVCPNAIELSDEDSYREACEDAGIGDPHYREVFEHWIVSEWLSDRIEENGGIVGIVCGVRVWGRTTTGQSITIDSIIEDIATELLAK